MQPSVFLLVVLLTVPGPALASCPTSQTVGSICKAGADLAAELASDMPVELGTLRLLFPVGTTDGVMIVGEALAGGGQPDPEHAGQYLCTDDGARDFVQSGGTIKVLLDGRPFLNLSDCGEF